MSRLDLPRIVGIHLHPPCTLTSTTYVSISGSVSLGSPLKRTAPQCYPAEVFPTKYRAFAHGISAACGKTGAIISALVFNTLTASIGTPAVLWSKFPLSSLSRHTTCRCDVGVLTYLFLVFFACCILGAGE